jgi:hypothetical protein
VLTQLRMLRSGARRGPNQGGLPERLSAGSGHERVRRDRRPRGWGCLSRVNRWPVDAEPRSQLVFVCPTDAVVEAA